MLYSYVIAQAASANLPEALSPPWWVTFLSACFACLVAFLITLAELITGKYPQTFGLFFKKSTALYSYGLAYGIFSFLVALFLDSLINSGQVRLEGLGTENPWVRSLIVGLSVKGFMKISLFNVTSGNASEPFPVGPASIIQIFEPSLLIQIGLDEFNSIGDYLKPYLANPAYEDVDEVRRLILENLPRIGSSAYRVGLVEDINESKSAKQLMEIYLVYFGAAAFSRVFEKSN